MKVGFVANVIKKNNSGLSTYASNLYSSIQKFGEVKEITWGEDTKFNKLFGTYINAIKAKPDVIHFPVYWITDLAALLLPSKAKKVLTVHDLHPLYMQTQGFAEWTATVKMAMKAADAIIAVSEYTKQDIMRAGIKRDKIHVIYEAASDNIWKMDIPKKPYILSVSSIVPRKNFGTLIKAFRRFKKITGLNYRLIIAGDTGGADCRTVEEYNRLCALVKYYDLQDDVIFTGAIDYPVLNLFYNAASLFVYPSFYEGFGLPILEAMRCGCSVITSNRTSMPEIVELAGHTFNPNEPDELSDLMIDILTNARIMKELSERSTVQEKKFSWDRAAKETWAVYKEVCDQ